MGKKGDSMTASYLNGKRPPVPPRSSAKVSTAAPVVVPESIPTGATQPDPELKPLFKEAQPEVMPEGWAYDDNGILCRVKQLRRGEELEPIFLGKISVIGSSEDVFNGQSSWRVRFKSQNRPVTIEAPRLELSRKKGALEYLSARGAPVHEENAAKVARFLSEYASSNEERIPHESTASRYGFTPSGDLVLPVACVTSSGDSVPLRFAAGIGSPQAKTGSNPTAYRDALEQILTWGKDAWVLLAALGFSLSSPFLAKLNPRRNPVLYFAGDSGAGKTTAARFAVAAWGLGSPLEMELGRTTKAGMLQTLEGLGGLPLFGDEAHSTQDPAALEATAYQFANGQSYTKGGKEGTAKGGTTLHGCLFMAGEALPDFTNAGSHRRLMFLRVDEHKPLAAPVSSSLGAERATMLEQTWLAGAGHLGECFSRGVLSDWQTYAALVKQHKGAFEGLGAWDVPLAAMVASVQTVCKLLDLELPDDIHEALFSQPPSVLTGARLEHEPAVTAWEKFKSFLFGARTTGGEANAPLIKEHQGQRIAWQKFGDTWRVVHNSPVLCAVMGGDNWLQKYGSEWVRRGWIRPNTREGNAVHVAKLPRDSNSVRVIILEPEKGSPQGG
jgi:hypothetical protein